MQVHRATLEITPPTCKSRGVKVSLVRVVYLRSAWSLQLASTHFVYSHGLGGTEDWKRHTAKPPLQLRGFWVSGVVEPTECARQLQQVSHQTRLNVSQAGRWQAGCLSDSLRKRQIKGVREEGWRAKRSSPKCATSHANQNQSCFSFKRLNATLHLHTVTFPFPACSLS